jgi:hypothetical protein
VAAVQQLAGLAVELQLGAAVGVAQPGAPAQPVVQVTGLARDAVQAVADVEAEGLRPALVQVAIGVVAQ